MLTKQQLLAQLTALARQKEKHQAEGLQLDGAIQMCRQLLSLCDRQESERAQAGHVAESHSQEPSLIPKTNGVPEPVIG